MPKPGEKYRHYSRGGEYEIVCLAKNEADESDVVVYKALYDQGHIWVRPLSNFVENVLVDGVEMPRFSKIG